MSTTPMVPTAPAHQPAHSAPARWFMGGRVEIRLSAGQTAGWLCVHDHRLPPGAATPLHVQPDDDESFIVLEGTVRFHLAGEEVDAGADDALHVPRGTPHAFVVTSPDPARLLIVGTPAGHDRFFLAAGDVPNGHGMPPAAPAGPSDMARMAAAAADAGFQILGPPPFAPRGA
ncbi:MAG: cupin domain-containing protein [Thermoleophilia bacterium]